MEELLDVSRIHDLVPEVLGLRLLHGAAWGAQRQ